MTFAHLPGLTKLGGWIGIVTALARWYASFAGVIAFTWGRAVVPAGARGAESAPQPSGSGTATPIQPGDLRLDGCVAVCERTKPDTKRSTRSRESDETLSNLMHENRRFDPPEELAEHANVNAEVYVEADADRLAFWAKAGRADRLGRALDRGAGLGNPPFAKWFVGGKVNAAYNCVDRHVEAGNGERVAYHWVGEPEGDTRDIDLRRAQGRGVPGGERAGRARGAGR